MLLGEKKLQIGITIYYMFSICIGLFSNILLLYFMKITKSALLRDMKYYLLNTAIFEILVTTSTFFAQCRPVTNEVTMAVFCYGPCKHFGQNTCHVAFAVVQSVVVASSISILLSFYYRYRLLILEVNKKTQHTKIILMFSLFPISSLLFQLLTDADFSKVEAETRRIHTDYDFEGNSIIGFSNTKSVGSIITQSMLALGIVLAPLIAFYYRRKINNILSRNTNQRFPIAYCKQLVNGLLLQTLVPFFVYIPPYSFVLYSLYSGHSNLYLEYILNTFGSFTAFINPALTFYFVLPYRRALCRKLFSNFSTVSDEGTQVTSNQNNNNNNNNNFQRREFHNDLALQSTPNL